MRIIGAIWRIIVVLALLALALLFVPFAGPAALILFAGVLAVMFGIMDALAVVPAVFIVVPIVAVVLALVVLSKGGRETFAERARSHPSKGVG